jgi:hypothetical protein
MNILDTLLKGILESKLGRIRWHSNMWALIGSQWDKKRIQNKNMVGSKDSNELGELIRGDAVVVKRKHTNNCPNPPGNDFYAGGKEPIKYYVPATECRKCKYHVPAGQRFRFPRCTFGKDSTNPSKAILETVDETTKLVNEAVNKANDLIKGKPF